MGKHQKTKGASAEREVAKILEKKLGTTLERNLEQTRGGGYDLIGLEHLGVALEVKRQERLNVSAWWKQAKEQTTEAAPKPVLFYRQNYKAWTVRLDLADFIFDKSVIIDTDIEGFITLLDYLRE